jgi:hypothetical protein
MTNLQHSILVFALRDFQCFLHQTFHVSVPIKELPEDSNDRRHARSFRNAHWNYIIHIIEPSNSRKRILYLSDRKGLACQNHEVVVAVDVVEDMGRFVLRRALCLWVELHEKIHQDSRKLFFYIFRSFDGRQARR